MNDKFKTAIELLENKSFDYQEKPHLMKQNYICDAISVKNELLVIRTNKRSFILELKDIDSFISNCEISSSDGVIKTNVVFKNEVELVASKSCTDVSAGLVNMFSQLQEENVSENLLKRAKAMSDIAGKIIDIEKVKISYRNLKN